VKYPAFIRGCAFALASLSTLALGIAPFGTAHAQGDYTRLVIAFPPGGPSDLLARAFSEQLGKELHQNIVVENRPGGNGAIAAIHVANEPADGKTLWLSTAGAFIINPALYPKLAYTIKQFAPVSLVVNTEEVLVVNPKNPANDAKEFVANAAKRHPSANIASSGIGSMPHIAIALLTEATHVPFLHVPEKGAAPVISDLMGGHVEAFFGDVPGVLSLIKSGGLKAIGLAGLKRHPMLPDVKTFDEQGIKGFDLNNWSGIFVSAKTSSADVARLNQGIRNALENPDTLKKLRALGMDPQASTPDELGRMVIDDSVKFKRVIDANHIQPE
jgi:tripartite-type tricarboxylate transporter receptor subunit TctC